MHADWLLFDRCRRAPRPGPRTECLGTAAVNHGRHRRRRRRRRRAESHPEDAVALVRAEERPRPSQTGEPHGHRCGGAPRRACPRRSSTRTSLPTTTGTYCCAWPTVRDLLALPAVAETVQHVRSQPTDGIGRVRQRLPSSVSKARPPRQTRPAQPERRTDDVCAQGPHGCPRRVRRAGHVRVGGGGIGRPRSRHSSIRGAGRHVGAGRRIRGCDLADAVHLAVHDEARLLLPRGADTRHVRAPRRRAHAKPRELPSGRCSAKPGSVSR